MNKSQQRSMLDLNASGDLLSDASKRALHYMKHSHQNRVYPNDAAIASLAEFDEALPDDTSDPAMTIAMLDALGSPATVASTGGRYFGFVTGGALPVAMAAKWLSDVWDQNSAFNIMSPVTGKLEEVCERWLPELLGLPRHSVAGFVSGSSMAIFCALAAARFRALKNQQWNVNQLGLIGAPALRIVASDQIHGAVTKAVALLGFGLDNVHWVPTDEHGRIKVDQVPELDSSSILILQAGNVNSGAYDDFASLCPLAREAGAWTHIDGAFGLWTAASHSLAHHTQGAELANSWSLDAHKTLNTPYDSGIVLCTDREAIISALQASGAYLQFSDSRDGILTTPEMSRRARATELWAVLRSLGRNGVDTLVTDLHRRAQQMASELRDRNFAIVNDVVFNQVLVRCPSDELTMAIAQHVQASGECWAGTSQWHGQTVIRISVCSWATTAEDISRCVQAFSDAKSAAESAIQEGYPGY